MIPESDDPDTITVVINGVRITQHRDDWITVRDAINAALTVEISPNTRWMKNRCLIYRTTYCPDPKLLRLEKDRNEILAEHANCPPRNWLNPQAPQTPGAKR